MKFQPQDLVFISNTDLLEPNRLDSRNCVVKTATEPDNYTVATEQLFHGHPKTISVKETDIKKREA